MITKKKKKMRANILNNELSNLKKEIEKNNYDYENIIEKTADEIENFIKKASSDNQIQ